MFGQCWKYVIVLCPGNLRPFLGGWVFGAAVDEYLVSLGKLLVPICLLLVYWLVVYHFGWVHLLVTTPQAIPLPAYWSTTCTLLLPHRTYLSSDFHAA